MSSYNPSRISGLQRLEGFVPRAGSEYARTRNFDFGPDNRANVSQLSPWVRHRLVTEKEVLTSVLQAHSLDAAEKFVQEVCWRTYWKGWLEMRPQVWSDYVKDVAALKSGLGSSEKRRYESAVAAVSGIECFDSWSEELIATGYLHNHARMWFASIWVFTLGLPWQLGADFFMQHLLDGDAASNTLSWRWVAGQQTLGKTYLARSDNIAKYTAGRFNETPKLASKAPDLPDLIAATRHSLPVMRAPDKSLLSTTALLVTDDDLTLPQSNVFIDQAAHALVLDTCHLRSPNGTGKAMQSFVTGALADFSERFSGSATVLQAERDSASLVDEVVDWCQINGVKQLVSACVPVGPTKDSLVKLEEGLQAQGIVWRQIRRSWDELAWPLATKGFFNFKKNIPGLIARHGIG